MLSIRYTTSELTVCHHTQKKLSISTSAFNVLTLVLAIGAVCSQGQENGWQYDCRHPSNCRLLQGNTRNKMAKLIPYALPSHIQKIQSLYKRYVRNLEAWYIRRDVFRFHACVARAEFDKILSEKDMIKAKKMLEDKEEQLFTELHYQPKKFPLSPGGTSYEREVIPPDWVVDYWHPLEKAHYPEYFARRELRKRQFVEMWEKQYGPPSKKEHH